MISSKILFNVVALLVVIVGGRLPSAGSRTRAFSHNNLPGGCLEKLRGFVQSWIHWSKTSLGGLVPIKCSFWKVKNLISSRWNLLVWRFLYGISDIPPIFGEKPINHSLEDMTTTAIQSNGVALAYAEARLAPAAGWLGDWGFFRARKNGRRWTLGDLTWFTLW